MVKTFQCRQLATWTSELLLSLGPKKAESILADARFGARRGAFGSYSESNSIFRRQEDIGGGIVLLL